MIEAMNGDIHRSLLLPDPLANPHSERYSIAMTRNRNPLEGYSGGGTDWWAGDGWLVEEGSCIGDRRRLRRFGRIDCFSSWCHQLCHVV